MLARCSMRDKVRFDDYAGRGITVSNELRDFKTFHSILGDRPKGKTLDRIDNDKGYTADNIKWATQKEQQRHKRSSRLLELDGVTRCASEWCEVLGIPWGRVKYRLNHGWSTRRALTTGLRN